VLSAKLISRAISCICSLKECASKKTASWLPAYFFSVKHQRCVKGRFILFFGFDNFKK
jgi:hypothetical protein